MQFQVVQGSIPCEVISYYDCSVSQHTDSDVPAWLGLRQLWLAQILGQAKAVTQGLALTWPGLGHGLCIYRLPAENRVIMYIKISSDGRFNLSEGHTMLPMGFCTSPSPTRVIIVEYIQH